MGDATVYQSDRFAFVRVREGDVSVNPNAYVYRGPIVRRWVNDIAPTKGWVACGYHRGGWHPEPACIPALKPFEESAVIQSDKAVRAVRRHMDENPDLYRRLADS